MKPQVCALICLFGFGLIECLSLCNTFGGCQIARSMSVNDTSPSSASGSSATGGSDTIKDFGYHQQQLDDFFDLGEAFWDDDNNNNNNLSGQMIDYGSGLDNDTPDTPTGATAFKTTNTKLESKRPNTPKEDGSLDSLKMAKEFFNDHSS